MKVTAIRPWLVNVPWPGLPSGSHLRQLFFVQVETDEGVTGWGEITTYPGPTTNKAVAAALREVGAMLEGDDPQNIEAIWHKVFRSFTYAGTRGIVSAIISGIDIALWDIAGKAAGKPIFRLLGGPVRDRVPLYTHPPEPTSPEGAVEDVRRIVEAGYKAFKFDPFSHTIPGRGIAYLDGQLALEAEERAVAIVAAVREAIGQNIEILIDAHGNYDVPTAVRLANRLAPYKIHWFEEPVPVESYRALEQVRREVSVPICVGERLHTRWQFVPVLEGNLADFIMPDVTWTGGISELKKIATLAEAYYVPVSPHDASGPINVLAGAHVMITVPNFYKLETVRYDLSPYNVLIDPPLDVRGGDLYLSERPGLGIEMDVEFMRAHAEPGFGG